ncbi:MAG: hypothetical protein ACK41E_10980 [Deinococcales bacterium]
MKKLMLLTLVLGAGLALAEPLRHNLRKITQGEAQTALSALCESNINLATRSCLAKKSFYTQVERNPKSLLELGDSGNTGAFSRSGAKEIVLGARFLDETGSEERFVGAISLLLSGNKVLRRMRYGNTDPSFCYLFSRGDGRDGLLCLSQAFGQGYLESTLEWRDIGAGAKAIELMRVTDNSAACGNPAKTFRFGDFEALDLNKDKKKDLVVNLSYASAANPDCTVTDLSKAPGKNYRLGFLWDGKTFKPDTATAAVLKGWK